MAKLKNQPHDMGGKPGFGPVSAEINEPIFHAEWEKKALALTIAMGFTGAWNLDISRHARETIPPNDYLSLSYYEIWLAGLEKLLLEREMITAQELTEGKMISKPVEIKGPLLADKVASALAAGGPVDRRAFEKPRFAEGSKIRTKANNSSGHTRLPAYANNAVGIISSVHGYHVFPDSNSKGLGENPQWLYNVKFKAVDLFGQDADSDHEVMLDCWEPYLDEL